MSFARFLALPLLTASLAASTADTVDVGGRPVQFPAPEGYVRCDGASPAWDKVAAALVAPTNHQLIVYGSPEDLAALKAGKPPAFSRSFNAQIVRGVEVQEVSEKAFASGKAEMKASLQAMHGKPPAAGQAQGRVENTILGFFEDTPTALGFTMALTTQVKEAAGSKESRRVVAALMTPVNGRLISMYATAADQSETERQWAEGSVKDWCDAVVAANPRVAGSMLEDVDFTRVGRAALIVALAGALIHLMRRFRRRGASKAH